MPGSDLPLNVAAVNLMDELSKLYPGVLSQRLNRIYQDIQAIELAEPLGEKHIQNYIQKIQEALQARGVGLKHSICLIDNAAERERTLNFLSFAIKADHTALIKLLIEVGFEKNPTIVEPPLVTAIFNGELETFKALEEQGCRGNEELLDLAIQWDHDDITQWLFDKGNYHGSELDVAVSKANEYAIKLLHTKSYVYKPDSKLPQNIKESCCPILYLAILEGHSEGLRLLLKTGKYDVLINTADKTLGTPLDYATACKQNDCVEILKAHLKLLPTIESCERTIKSCSNDAGSDNDSVGSNEGGADIFSDDEDPTPPATPPSSFQLKFLYTCATLSSATLIAGVITLCLFSTIGAGSALAAVGAAALILSAVGLYKYNHKAQNTDDKKPGLSSALPAVSAGPAMSQSE